MKEVLSVDIFLTGSYELSDYDKFEIHNYLENYIGGHHYHLLVYRNIEKEILKFFIKNDDKCGQLTVYLPYTLNEQPKQIKEPLLYLKKLGTKVVELKLEDKVMYRSTYLSLLERIILKTDSVLSFYNEDNSKRLIPVDFAKKYQIESHIFDLPKNDEDKIYRQLEEKIRVV